MHVGLGKRHVWTSSSKSLKASTCSTRLVGVVIETRYSIAFKIIMALFCVAVYQGKRPLFMSVVSIWNI